MWSWKLYNAVVGSNLDRLVERFVAWKHLILLQEQAKVRMVKQKNSDKTPTYWSNLWGKPKDHESKGKMKIHLFIQTSHKTVLIS